MPYDRPVEKLNLNGVSLERDEDDPAGYSVGYLRLGKLLGASMLGGTVYELEPGNANCPYHFEHGNEEWLFVLSGVVTVRHPEGEDEVAAGEVVCFPEGPAGAHKLANRSDATARFLVLSTLVSPSASVYPDSGKIGIWPNAGGRDALIVRQESGVDYWDGEL